MARIYQRIVLFIETWKMIAHGLFKEGEIWAGVKESKRRFDICLKCPKFEKAWNGCDECGCFMKVKTKFKNAGCPLKHW